MDWSRIESNWHSQFLARAASRWPKLTEGLLAASGGRRLGLAHCLQDVYLVSPGEADRQVAEWQRRQSEAEPEKR